MIPPPSPPPPDDGGVTVSVVPLSEVGVGLVGSDDEPESDDVEPESLDEPESDGAGDSELESLDEEPPPPPDAGSVAVSSAIVIGENNRININNNAASFFIDLPPLSLFLSQRKTLGKKKVITMIVLTY